MNTDMSRKATMEYVGAKRRAYTKLKTTVARSAALDEFCTFTGAERKYANKLLLGSRKYREHKGRGKTYTSDAEMLLLRLWRESGFMTPQYLVTVSERQMHALLELEHVDEVAAAQVLNMSASTMERVLRAHPREAPRRRNRRSGANALSSCIPCVPGEATPPAACGETQVDTVALCGGDMSGNFFWILTQTDRLTQWTQCHPVWNRGAENTKAALVKAETSFPFKVTEMHSDSGGEFMNAHVFGYAKEREKPLVFTRSRPGNKNDNARVEQKNGSIVREYFGYERFDRLELKADLDALCVRINLYNNLFRPCKRIISKTKKPNAHGFIKKYDLPRPPLDRAIESGGVDPRMVKKLLALRDSINPIRLLEGIWRRHDRVLRKQMKITKEEKKIAELTRFPAASPRGDGEEGRPKLATLASGPRPLPTEQKGAGSALPQPPPKTKSGVLLLTDALTT